MGWTDSNTKPDSDPFRDMRESLAHWQRHGVLVTQDCPTCGGDGFNFAYDGVNPYESRDCPTCSGSGKVPADGVIPVWHAGGISRAWYQ